MKSRKSFWRSFFFILLIFPLHLHSKITFRLGTDSPVFFKLKLHPTLGRHFIYTGFGAVTLKLSFYPKPTDQVKGEPQQLHRPTSLGATCYTGFEWLGDVAYPNIMPSTSGTYVIKGPIFHNGASRLQHMRVVARWLEPKDNNAWAASLDLYGSYICTLLPRY